ncbi:EAL domain-containing protein [Vibrio lamellibrachiae]|uniref:putative bifunctional diguanylate cyclase/phosphodiesterase n=1 Tax=Vibrio lamellibrachiae TaxID=2910253 RepID=UPI003D12245C
MPSANQRIRTLQVEDNPGDSRLLYEYLYRENASDVDLKQVETLSGALSKLTEEPFDVVLLDLSLPDASGLEAVYAVLKHDPAIAVVVVSSLDDEGTALEALKSGAQDYIVKGKFDSYILHKSIRYALERKKIKDRLSYLAQYDALTGLLNRSSFLSRVSEALERSKRSMNTMAVFFIDMDKFKQVNDTLGHSAGDELLRQITGRFKASVRKQDCVARLAGDEFAILMESMNSMESTEVVTQKLFGLMQEPFQLDEGLVYISVSIGITVVSDQPISTEEALKQADIAMYKAKREPSNSVHYYDNQLEELLACRHQVKDKISQNLDEELLLEFQPIVNDQGQVVAVETFPKWNLPAIGDLYAESFLPFLDDIGYTIPCGKWTLEESCRVVSQWHKEGIVDSEFVLCINLSAKQIEDKSFITTVEKVLEQTQFPPRCLRFEITEKCLYELGSLGNKVFEKLSDLNVSLSIDAFGKGYMSLHQLTELPFEAIKIHSSLIQGLPFDNQSRTMVRSIIALATELNKSVLAEGVQTSEQKEQVIHFGCNRLQGELFSKSISNQEFLGLLTNSKRERVNQVGSK